MLYSEVMHIPLASSGLRSKDIESAIEVLNSGNLTMGSQVREFESRMSDYLGVSDFVMMNSGSSANLAMIEALLRPTRGRAHLKSGDGILVPAIAWPTTVWPIIQLGLEPIFVDVNIDSLAIDLDNAQQVIDSGLFNVKGIFPIHPLGNGIKDELLDKFVTNNKLILINDVCESLGSFQGKIHSGTSGFGGSFSFYFSHHITTMEGGGVATNNSEFADDLRSIRSHGWSRDRSDSEQWSNSLSRNDAKFLFVSTGFNIRPMEIQAAIGVSQLSDIDKFLSRRKRNAEEVSKVLDGSQLRLIGSDVFCEKDSYARHSWMMLPIALKTNATVTKKHIVSFLNNSGIETRPVLTGNFLNQPAVQRLGINKRHEQDFPNADYLTENAFLIGNHHDFSDAQLDYLIAKLLEALRIGK
jgi:CDP-6-deoxy-D-xylo-4-hexulose-3-dehydrase